jgi:hypothetical protein
MLDAPEVIPGFNRQPMSHYSSHAMSGYFETGYMYQFANTYQLKPSDAVEFGIPIGVHCCL